MNYVVDAIGRVAERRTDARVELVEGNDDHWMCHLYIDGHCVAFGYDGEFYRAEELSHDLDTIFLHGYENVFESEEGVISWLEGWALTLDYAQFE